MDSILNELGAVEENENDVQRSVLKEKILKSIRFPRTSRDDLNPCEPVTVIGGFPELTKNSQQLMLTELRREVQDLKLLRGRSSLYEVAVIKLRFFQAILCIPDGFDILENATRPSSTFDESRKADKSMNGCHTSRHEVKFMSLVDVGREPGHSMSSSSKYSQNAGYGGSNLGLHDLNLHIHGKDRITQKWKIDNNAIDELTSEAINSKTYSRSDSAMSSRDHLNAATNKVCDHTELLRPPITSISNLCSTGKENPDNLLSDNLSDIHDEKASSAAKRKLIKLKEIFHLEVAGKNPVEERLIKKTRRESSNRKISDSKVAQRLPIVKVDEIVESVTCPICGNDLAVHQLGAAAVLDRHIDRCTRRMETERLKAERRVTSGNDFVLGKVMDLACTSDVEEAEGTLTKRKTRAQAKCGARGIRSIYMESDESDNNSDSDIEDAREDYTPGCYEDLSESDVDSEAETDDDSPSSESKLKNRGGKKVKASTPGGGRKRRKDPALPIIAEPLLRKKDKRMAEKLLKESRSGRGVNRKGIIEEDKAEVFDDWEDDYYLERLNLIGIGDFEETFPDSPDIVIKEQYSGSHSDEDSNHVVAVNDVGTSSSRLHQGYIEIDEVLDIDKHTWATLFEYQKEGIRWLFSLYESGVGGSLGDEMGLGKTAQLCCHFGSLSRKQRKLRKKNGIFLVVCPATVLQHWLKEFHRWVPAMRCVIMHSISRTGAEVQQLAESGILSIDSLSLIHPLLN